MAADSIPGTALIRSRMRSVNRRTVLIVDGGTPGLILIVTSRSGEKPGDTCSILTKLRIISPAAASNTTENATCAISSAERSRLRLRLDVPREAACRNALPSHPPVLKMGARPNIIPVPTLPRSVNSSTGASTCTSAARVVKRPAKPLALVMRAVRAPRQVARRSRRATAFRKQLPHQPRFAGSQCGANRHFPLQLERPQKVRDVRPRGQ